MLAGGLVEPYVAERLLAVRTFVEAGWRRGHRGGSEKLVLVALLTVLGASVNGAFFSHWSSRPGRLPGIVAVRRYLRNGSVIDPELTVTWV